MLALLVLWLRGKIAGSLPLKLLLIGFLGGFQAAIGWIMVASGLEPGMTAVAPVKLMLHLVVASIILGCLVAIARGLSRPENIMPPSFMRKMARAIVFVMFIQIALGALVAGSKAGLSYNTWPLMDGLPVPPLEDLFVVTPWYENFFDNVALVQFQHRAVAYFLLVLVCVHAIMAKRVVPGSVMARQAGLVAVIVLIQAFLGVMTLILIRAALGCPEPSDRSHGRSRCRRLACRLGIGKKVSLSDTHAVAGSEAQRLIQVGDKVSLVLDANRKAHNFGSCAGCGQLLRTQLPMGCRSRMDDQGAGIADIGEV